MLAAYPWLAPLLLEFGENVRAARWRRGLVQSELAWHSGVSQSSISRLERGRTTGMTLEKLIRLAYVLGIEFPLGRCPHDHLCAWRSLSPTLDGRREGILSSFLRSANEGHALPSVPLERDPDD